jgi:hypothetical protein
MANVLNRTTKMYLKSVHTPDFPGAAWVVNPAGANALEAAGIPSSRWAINPDDSVREMTAAEQDGAFLTEEKMRRVGEVRIAFTDYVASKYDVSSQVTLNALWNEAGKKNWNNRNNKVQQIMTWLDAVLTEFYARKNAIIAASTIAAAKAVSADFSTFDATVPSVTVEQVFVTKN